MDVVQVKGAFLRGYRAALQDLGLYAEVLEGCTPAVREALEMPPPTSSWVDYALVEGILRVVEAKRGMRTVRKLGHDAVSAGVAPFMQIFVQGLLRVFGVSPATLFANLNRVAAQTTRGMAYAYEATSEASGIMTVSLVERRNVEPIVWQASAGGLEIVFDTCKIGGHVQDPVLVDNGLGNTTQFRVTWRKSG